MIDSDDDIFRGLADHNSRQRKHKVVAWSVEETRQFYDVYIDYKFSQIVSSPLWNGLFYDEQGYHQSNEKRCTVG